MKPSIILLACAVLLVAGGNAQAVAPAGKLQLELNTLQPAEQACRVTFLATNGLGSDISKATFELAIFGKDGGIDRLVSADFTGLTSGKTKVLQFDLKGLVCGDISRVLVNDVTACSGDGIVATACLGALQTIDKTTATFGT